MKTDTMLRGEWTARPLRPVARWVPIIDETGRSRLVMTWAVPDPEAAAARDLFARA
ncbi:MAG TPA: hypothetical protein VHN80_26260 [Kineosporiaceae bacterium]|jgi:hypothetical protein|nr:hypothetical protein [Kineosporiaceae bacterium]